MQYEYRTGIGTDIHKLVSDRPLLLGGVQVPFELGLLGHSDGDVVHVGSRDHGRAFLGCCKPSRSRTFAVSGFGLAENSRYDLTRAAIAFARSPLLTPP